jgi:methylase of polypeptide subunit release factors
VIFAHQHAVSEAALACWAKDRVPIQYLTNCVHWRDLVLTVGPGALIPRPETELLIDICDRVRLGGCRIEPRIESNRVDECIRAAEYISLFGSKGQVQWC